MHYGEERRCVCRRKRFQSGKRGFEVSRVGWQRESCRSGGQLQEGRTIRHKIGGEWRCGNATMWEYEHIHSERKRKRQRSPGDEQGEAESGERADGKLQGIPDGG